MIDINGKKFEELPRVRMAYNEKQLGLKKAKEISKYKAEIKLPYFCD